MIDYAAYEELPIYSIGLLQQETLTWPPHYHVNMFQCEKPLLWRTTLKQVQLFFIDLLQ